jgi:hypothetical protein
MVGMDTSAPIDRALAELTQSFHEYRIAEDRVEREIAEARRVRDRAIARAKRNGIRQNRIMEVTGYSRETIRQIVRDTPLDDAEGEPADEEEAA